MGKIKGKKNVYENLLKNLNQEKKNNPYSNNLCWHPLFSNNKKHLQLSEFFKILDSSSEQKKPCLFKSNIKPEKKEIAQKLLKSITGESSFIVSNGYSKILRLPKGKYEYEILENKSKQEKSSKNSRKKLGEGSFLWSKKRSYQTISKL